MLEAAAFRLLVLADREGLARLQLSASGLPSSRAGAPWTTPAEFHHPRNTTSEA
jgi:hypothetical protein